MMKTTNSTRRIEFERCVNFRDLGGYALKSGGTLRWGKIFRSDSIHGMTASDARRARAGLGIRTIIDLRTEAEATLYGIGLLGLPPVRHYQVSMLAYKGLAADWDGWRSSPQLSDCYSALLNQAGPALAQIIRILARPGALPAVFHCMAGKDRTGIAAAVILSALGADEEDIVSDYALTEEYAGTAPVARGPAGRQESEDRQIPTSLLAASPETMRCFLKMVVDSYGSIHRFLDMHGVTPGEIRGLREALVCQPGRPRESTEKLVRA